MSDSVKQPEKLPTFTFDLVGDGREVFVGTFDAKDQEHAVKSARKLCSRFSLPIWQLRCRETGNSFPAVCLIDSNGEKTFLPAGQ